MRKKTHSEVEPSFLAEGYQLLCKYESAHHKMQVRCPVGHEVLITWSHFNRGRRCPQCAKLTRADKRRTPENLVRQAFKDAGYELLVDHYRDNSTRMDCICPQGHHIKMDWASFIAVPERMRYTLTERSLAAYGLGQLTCTSSE